MRTIWSIWSPFVFAGFGFLAYDNDNSGKLSDHVQYPDLGFGLSIKLGPIVSLTLDETLLFINYDKANRLEAAIEQANKILVDFKDFKLISFFNIIIAF